METQLAFKDSVITEKQKSIVTYLTTNNPDILAYYSKTELEEFINEKIKTYYSEYEKHILLGFQSVEAEELAGNKLYDFNTSYSRLSEILVENYAFSIDVFDLEVKEKILYFSKEYRVLIDEEKNISSLIEAFFFK
jgi:hypothetical protein